MRNLMILSAVSLSLLLTPTLRAESHEELREQVRAAETAFAKTMADRDHEAFKSFLAEDAIFLSGTKALKGKAAVAAGWKPLYEKPEAAFSWAPETVEVTASGTLAISTGPVLDASGKEVGRFNSAWRREADGTWKVVLDNGCDACACSDQ